MSLPTRLRIRWILADIAFIGGIVTVFAAAVYVIAYLIIKAVA